MSVSASIGILLTKEMGVVEFCEKVILANFRLVNRENEEFYYAALGSEYIEEYERVLSASDLMRVVEQKKLPMKTLSSVSTCRMKFPQSSIGIMRRIQQVSL